MLQFLSNGAVIIPHAITDHAIPLCTAIDHDPWFPAELLFLCVALDFLQFLGESVDLVLELEELVLGLDAGHVPL